jgi:hypothetical protein
LIAGDPKIVQTFRLSEAALAKLRSSAEDPSQVPGQRQAIEQAARRVQEASAAIDQINRAASIPLTVNTAYGGTLDAILGGYPIGSTIANLANQYRNDLTLESNAQIRQWAGSLVYGAVNLESDAFRASANGIMNTPGISNTERRARLEALLSSTIERTRNSFFNQNNMLGGDAELQTFLFAQGQRFMTEMILVNQGLQALQANELSASLDEAIRRIKNLDSEVTRTRGDLINVSNHMTSVISHFGEVQVGLDLLIQRRISNGQVGLSGEISGEAIDFLLQATSGDLSLQTQIDLLRDGYPPGMPQAIRDGLLASARAARIAEVAAGAREFGTQVETASRVIAGMSRMAEILGADAETRNALINLQNNLQIGQTLVGTFASTVAAFGTGGYVSAAVALFSGLGGLPGQPSDPNAAMMGEIRGLFDRVFRELENINVKLDQLIQGQRTIMGQIRDLGRQLQGTEDRIIWEVRRVSQQIVNLQDALESAPGGTQEGWARCRVFREGENLTGLRSNWPVNYGISFDQNSRHVNFMNIDSRSQYLQNYGFIFGDIGEFGQCERVLALLTTYISVPSVRLGVESSLRPNHFFRVDRWLHPSYRDSAPIELSDDYFVTSVQATFRLLNVDHAEGNGDWCASQLIGTLGVGLTSFRQVVLNRLQCPAEAKSPTGVGSDRPLRARHEYRLSTQAVSEVAREINFMSGFYALMGSVNPRPQLYTSSEVSSHLASGSETAFGSADAASRARTLRSGHLRTVEAAIAQEGFLSGVALVDIFRQSLLPDFDPTAAIDLHAPVAPLGDGFWRANAERRALLTLERGILNERLEVERAELAERALAAGTTSATPATPQQLETARQDVSKAKAALTEAIRGRSVARGEGAPPPPSPLPAEVALEAAFQSAQRKLADMEFALAQHESARPRVQRTIDEARAAVREARSGFVKAIAARVAARGMQPNLTAQSTFGADIEMLNLIAAGRVDRVTYDPSRGHPANQRCRAASPLQRTEGQVEALYWDEITSNHLIPLIGCLFRINPLWASNFVRQIVLTTMAQRGTAVETYAVAYGLRPEFLMRQILRGLPIARDPRIADRPELGGNWVMLIRDEHGGIIRVPLPTPSNVVTQAVDVPAAMGALIALRQQLVDGLLASTPPRADDSDEWRALIWEAGMRVQKPR